LHSETEPLTSTSQAAGSKYVLLSASPLPEEPQTRTPFDASNNNFELTNYLDLESSSGSESETDGSAQHEILAESPEPGSEDEESEDEDFEYIEATEDSIPPVFNVPECIKAIQDDLLNGYTPPEKPSEPLKIEELDSSQTWSLRHYVAWRRSNGTVRAFNEHRQVLQDATNVEILSLHRVRALALRLARITPKLVDMCPKSCIAYTGEYTNLTHCPYIHPKSKAPCNEPRFRSTANGKVKPRAQVTILPIMPSIQALFANEETSRQLLYRSKSLWEILKLVGDIPKSKKRFSDFANGTIHTDSHFRAMGLFKDDRDVALALSSDGAQLTLKKQSNTWISIIMLLNLPPDIRYHARNIIINFATPGPNAPGDIESFLRPTFEELARASQGIWLWDSLNREWFLNRAYATIILGDMLGSAKVSGMSGHSAVRGDRFSTTQGARSSTQKGAKAQYYPLSPPDTSNRKYNTERPTYSPDGIELRKQDTYWGILQRLATATTKAEKARISKETGVSKIPVAAASPAFVHPSYFPLDPFHLFYENCMPWFWDIWTIHAKSPEIVRIPPKKVEALGKLVAEAMKTLPPVFCGSVRNPHLKRQSQYKAYEWMAILHWYLLPIGLELEIDYTLLQNFSLFAYIVEFSMTVAKRSEDELTKLQGVISTFLQQFERLYVGDDPEKIHRCRLCMFQLIHVPTHIKWFGSIRMGSQAPVERAIGEMGHKIHSKKNPFSDLTNIIIELEVIRVLQLYYPNLAEANRKPDTQWLEVRVAQQLKIGRNEAFISHLQAMAKVLGLGEWQLEEEYHIERFGKLRLVNGQTLRSKASEETSATTRHYRWFEVNQSFSPQ
jgi:hypothetical protein